MIDEIQESLWTHAEHDENKSDFYKYDPHVTLQLEQLCIRVAADWQLEQVIAHILAAEWFVLPEWRISELQKAMRPQQQEDN
jgi:hypothetical protein